ncbi:MAG: vWA domain-containing protein, partial [Methanobacterium sp.]
MAIWGKGTYGPWSPPNPDQHQDQQGQGDQQQDQQGQGDQQQDQQGQGKPQPGQGQGQGKPQPGQGQGQGEPKESGQSIDDIYKDLENKFKNKKDIAGNEPAEQPGTQAAQGSTTGGGPNQSRERIEKVATPAFSWKQLMSQFVLSQKKPESTYAKISKRSITGVATAMTTGAGVVKPGERIEEEAFKLLFVFDTSGSMGGVISTALAEASNLIKQNFDNGDSALGVTFFAVSPEYYAANLSDGVYWPVASFNDLDKPSRLTRPIGELFKMKLSGGTNFTTGLAGQLGAMATKGYNVILFTDSDILIGSNWKNFLNFYKNHKRHMFLILDNRYTFNQVFKQ